MCCPDIFWTCLRDANVANLPLLEEELQIQQVDSHLKVAQLTD
jgi:hypothetical protein